MMADGIELNCANPPPAHNHVLHEWRERVAQGRQLMGERAYARALHCFSGAMLLAEWLFEHWPDADEAMRFHVVSHHNMADTLAHLGELECAAGYVCAIERRLGLLAGNPAESPQRRAAAQRHGLYAAQEVQRMAWQVPLGSDPLQSEAAAPGWIQDSVH